MLKLVWVNPRDPRSVEGWVGISPWEATHTRPAANVTFWERLLLAASGVYSVALFWGLWRMLLG
jgi:hypothetical protein